MNHKRSLKRTALLFKKKFLPLLDKLYVRRLRLIPPHYHMPDNDELRAMDRINITAFPPELYDEVNLAFDSDEELCRKCGCTDRRQIEGHYQGSWYIVMVHYAFTIYIKDCAADLGRINDPMVFFRSLAEIFEPYKKKTFIASCRKKTSYAILKILERRSNITILSEKPFTFVGEPYYHMIFKVNA
ncbi:MAG TPA: hypothetical protein DCZ71_02390 [Ruminococcus sp.]|nr:hypothetical protein [Ruminococcus sp.]